MVLFCLLLSPCRVCVWVWRPCSEPSPPQRVSSAPWSSSTRPRSATPKRASPSAPTPPRPPPPATCSTSSPPRSLPSGCPARGTLSTSTYCSHSRTAAWGRWSPTSPPLYSMPSGPCRWLLPLSMELVPVIGPKGCKKKSMGIESSFQKWLLHAEDWTKYGSALVYYVRFNWYSVYYIWYNWYSI